MPENVAKKFALTNLTEPLSGTLMEVLDDDTTTPSKD